MERIRHIIGLAIALVILLIRPHQWYLGIGIGLAWAFLYDEEEI